MFVFILQWLFMSTIQVFRGDAEKKSYVLLFMSCESVFVVG